MSSEKTAVATMSATEAGEAIGALTIDPRDLVEQGLSAAASRDDVFTSVTAKRARREAAAAYDRAKRGFRRGPLDGVPISWKDLLDVAGEPTEAGSKLLEGRVAEMDAALVARASRAGLVCLGKTHLSELAFSGLGVNPMTATPPNKYDAALAPGGSSSGAAASIALGAVSAAIGSDTGGSVRIPAAWNGLVGLKTSHGLLPMDGVTPLSPSLDTIGPLAKNVTDANALLSALTGGSPADLQADGAKLRLLAPKTVMLDGVDDDRLAAFEAAMERLKLSGVQCVKADFPEFEALFDVMAANGGVVNTEGYAIWRDVIEAAPEKMFSNILDRFRSGARFRADQAEFVHLEIRRLKAAAAIRLAGFDGLIAPTTPNTPPPLDRLLSDPEFYATENLRALRNTRIGNLLDFCSITLPTPAIDARFPDAYPGAVMISAPSGQDAKLLRVAFKLEKLLSIEK